jgi:periplasmic protein TonB
MFSGLAGIEHHPARRWTATASFMLQSALVMGAFIYPLLHLNVLPETLLRPRIFVPVSNGEVPPETASRDRASGPSPALHPIVVSPWIKQSDFDEPNIRSWVPICASDRRGRSREPKFANQFNPQREHSPGSAFGRISRARGSEVLRPRGPVDPSSAKQLYIQGAVVIDALIGRDGRIEQTTVIRGQALLNKSAMEAIKQWQYRPYYLNGEPVEVETQITVNFVMEH